MSTNQPRDPRGVSTGGRWRGTRRPEGNVCLSGQPRSDCGPAYGEGRADIEPSADERRRRAKQVDREIARLSSERSRVLARAGSLARLVEAYAKRPSLGSTSRQYAEELEELRAEAGRLRDQLAPYEAEYARQPWSRAFVVPGGHVHRSMECSTCYATTQFAWLPDYSGAPEEEIVADAGERCCTVCYPSAPVEVLARPTKIYSDEERRGLEAKEARSLEQAKKRAERAAKAISAPDGQPLYVWSWGFRDKVATEVTARRQASEAALEAERMRSFLDRLSGPEGSEAPAQREKYESRLAEQEANVQLIAEAIAAKHGRTVEEVLEELRRAAGPKLKRWRREGCW